MSIHMRLDEAEELFRKQCREIKRGVI